jgi:asparagine synthase (glutamine-hydrolysing)
MCGITGFVGIDDERLLRAMCSVLIHRGPDEDGFYSAPGIGLAMRRLAIIDLKTGSQPIANESRDIWVVFNGEIYNYQELRKDLLNRGHILSTTSDTETIVHLYEDYDLGFLGYLRGMFSIALWDEKRGRLILARDRIGEKPLFYSLVGNHLFFGSEIKAILQAVSKRSVEPQAICDYLTAGYVPGGQTFYQGISKLPPGHLLIWEKGKIDVRRYWQYRPERNRVIPFDEAAVRLGDLLDETVRLCLKSDVEVGGFLSGGIDSSVICALMRKHDAEVQTFSVGYQGEATGFNELGYAKRVAQFLGTHHHELILSPRSSMELLPQILWHYDEPHGEPTSVLVYLLCEFTRQRVKVALSGTGGDEIFFGYPRHTGIRMLQYYRLLPAFFRKYMVDRVISKWPESTKGSRFAKRAKRFISGSDLSTEEAYLTWLNLLPRDARDGLATQDIERAAADPAGDRFLRDHLTESDQCSLMDRVAALDVEGYLPEYQLAYMDRMSMAHGLEVRSPLCDFELVSFVTSLPTSYRLNGLRTKRIFKEIAKRWIPAEIAERRKVGFDSPIGQWFKGELREFLVNFLSVQHVKRSGLLDPQKVQAVINDHLSGRRDYSLQLWSLLALEGWYRMYIEDNVTDGSRYRLTEMRGGERYAHLV